MNFIFSILLMLATSFHPSAPPVEHCDMVGGCPPSIELPTPTPTPVLCSSNGHIAEICSDY